MEMSDTASSFRAWVEAPSDAAAPGFRPAGVKRSKVVEGAVKVPKLTTEEKDD